MAQTAKFSEYFLYAAANLVFKHRHNKRTGQTFDFALVPSQECGHEPYLVGIKDGHAINCECPDHIFRHRYCKHQEIADYRMCMDREAAERFRQYDVVAAALDIAVDAGLGDTYEELAKTKKPAQFAWGSCGHRVKPGHDGELCGGCRA